MRYLRVPLALATMLAGIVLAGPSSVHAAATTLTCPVTFATLNAAIPTASGSNVTINITNTSASPCLVDFSAGGPITINNGVTVSIFNTSPAGNGAVQFDGGNNRYFFAVSPSGSLSLTGLTLQHGLNNGRGGALFSDGALTVANCTFLNNTSGFEGGAIYADGKTTITNSAFTNNIATFNEGIEGGAVANNGLMTIANSIFTGNSTEIAILAAGGAIANDQDGTMAVIGSTITNSTVNLAEEVTLGGGIANFGALSVVNSTISANAANSIGIFNQVIFGLGGGIFSDQPMTLLNSTITGNSAFAGGGVFVGDILSVGNSIVAGNQLNGFNTPLPGFGATPPGITDTGTPHGWKSTASKTLLAKGLKAQANVITPFAPDILDDSGFINHGVTDLGNNLIGDETGTVFGSFHDFSSANGDLVGASASPINPVLGALANNGGPLAGAPSSAATVQTMALLTGSPAINHGRPATCLLPPVGDVDQRVTPRDTALRATCDIGAYDTGGAVDAIGTVLLGSPIPARLGFASLTNPKSANLNYITLRYGANTWVARQSVVTTALETCTGSPCTATLTLTGTADSARGPLAANGQKLKVIITVNATATATSFSRSVTNVETQVWSGATSVLDIQTPAPMPFGSAVQLYAALPAATV